MSGMENPFPDKSSDELIKQYGKYIVAAVAACVLVVGIVLLSGRHGGEKTASAGTDVIGLTDGRGAETTAANGLKADVYPEVNQLIHTYFTAMRDKDVETLTNIVESSTEITAESVRKANEFIEDYTNIKCYTRDGIIEGTYIVYVYHDVKFENVDTPAPSMYRMYVCTNEDGSLYISQDTPEGEVAAYMDEIHKSDEVSHLYASVNDAFQAAMKQDEKLARLVAGMHEGAAPELPEETQTEPEHEGEKVYALQSVNIRKDPSTEGEPVGQLYAGASIRRVGTEGDWSRVIYDGAECYIVSEYLTADDISGSVFRDVDEQVEALQNVRVRREPSVDSEEMGMLTGGANVRRTGYNDNWSRVVYDDETGYVASEFLR